MMKVRACFNTIYIYIYISLYIKTSTKINKYFALKYLMYSDITQLWI